MNDFIDVDNLSHGLSTFENVSNIVQFPHVVNRNHPELLCLLSTGLHTQKAYTHTGTSSHQSLLLSTHAYMHFA